MKGMPFSFQGEGVSELAAVAATTTYWSTTSVNNSSSSNNKRKEREEEALLLSEPCSVLDHNRSPSPPTSTSTLSSSLGGGGGGGGSSDSAGVAALSGNNPTTTKWQQQNQNQNQNQQPTSGNNKNEDWASELQPNLDVKGGGGGGPGLDDWESMLSAGSPTQEQTFLHWIMTDTDDSKSILPSSDQAHSAAAAADFEPFGELLDPITSSGAFDAPPLSLPSAAPPVPNSLPMFFQETTTIQQEQKPHHLIINQNQHQHLNPNPSFFLPQPHLDAGHVIIPPNPKRHHSIPTNHVPFSIQQRPLLKPKDEAAAMAMAQQQQALVDQLFKAAELVEAGNPFGAREILARLNHMLPPSSPPLGLNPLLRSAFLFKEILGALAANNSLPSAPLSNPWDVVLKLSTYKAFSEVSPLIHFTNLTCTQTLLEEIGASDSIHIVDFDIGIGGQWSSFMQGLAQRGPPGSVPFLRITAFVSPSAFHPLELHLTRENLSHFAAELSIPFEFNFLSVESFNPSEIIIANETIAVNLPIGSHYAQSFPTILRLVKQLNPKIVVSVDQGCNRSDLPFSHHFLHSLQSCMVLLDSIDAAGTNADMANKIERFLVQPRAESAVAGRHRTADKLPPWRALFTSLGFVPFQFSNFTETQAECLLKRVQVRGFHVEKRQASLFLYWQRGELGSVSAWKC